MTPQPKPQREIDAEYTAFVKTHPCCLPTSLFPHACGLPAAWGIQGHHVSPRTGTKSAASKVSDWRQVPVCFNGHRYCEVHPQEVLEFLNRVIERINREFRATQPMKPKVTRKPSLKVGLGVKNCPACRGEHFYRLPPPYSGGYTCKITGAWVPVESMAA